VTSAAPGRVLALAVLGWGLGHLALDRRIAGTTWLLAELVALALVALTLVLWADTTWYLVPFVAGWGFIGLWAVQAISAYRAARAHDPDAGAASGSAAAVIAWLTVPILVWGTGFWLVAAASGSPSAVLDRFVTAWPEVTDGRRDWADGLADSPSQLTVAAERATDRLEELCSDGELAEDCDTAPEALLRDIRLRLVARGDASAVAVAELVRFERRPTTVLWVFRGTEQVAVPTERLLELELGVEAAAGGAARWRILNAQAG
jgi:hypothetical protein